MHIMPAVDLIVSSRNHLSLMDDDDADRKIAYFESLFSLEERLTQHDAIR